MAVSSILAGTGRSAAAADTQVILSCQRLDSEEAAKIETRIRVQLLAAASGARVSISCREQQATVVVEADRGRATRDVTLGGIDAGEALILAIESALEELAGQPAESAAPPSVPALPTPSEERPPLPQEPAPSSPGPVLRLPAAPTSVERPPASAPGSERFTELSATALAESWRDRLALGGAVGTAYGSRTFLGGVRVAGLTAVPRYDDFNASELSAEVAIAWQPAWSFGLRLRVSAGPSLLVVAPRGSVKPRAGTTVAAWFGGVTLARPFRVGHWAFVPELGARLFSSKSSVNLDDHEQLVLGPLVPHLGIGLTY